MFVFEGYNDDISGDSEILLEAVKDEAEAEKDKKNWRKHGGYTEKRSKKKRRYKSWNRSTRLFTKRVLPQSDRILERLRSVNQVYVTQESKAITAPMPKKAETEDSPKVETDSPVKKAIQQESEDKSSSIG